MEIFVYLTLGLCACLVGLLVYRYDMYEKEPWYMILGAAALGFGVMWTMGPLETFTVGHWPQLPAPAPVYAAVAATHEEIARLLVVLGLAMLFRRHFNDPMDGIIYGSIVGVGMALEESNFFMRLDPPDGPFLPPSELVRLCGHLVFGGITGFGVGMMRMRRRGWAGAMVGCLGVSVGLHFAWDWIAFTVAETQAMQWWQTAAAVAIMVGGILFYGMLVVVGSDWSRQVFDPHSAKTLWGWPLTMVVGGGTRARRHEGTER